MNKLITILVFITCTIFTNGFSQTYVLKGGDFQPNGTSVVIREDTVAFYNTRESFAKIYLPAGDYKCVVYAKGDMAPTATDYPRLLFARNLMSNVQDSINITSETFKPFIFSFKSVSDTSLIFVRMSKDYRNPRTTPPQDRNAYLYSIMFTKSEDSLPSDTSNTNIDSVDVAVSWNANTENDLAGYKIYYGFVTGVYDRSINVGNMTFSIIRKLPTGMTLYLVVTAYDIAGNESDYSVEVSKYLMLKDTTAPLSPTGVEIKEN